MPIGIQEIIIYSVRLQANTGLLQVYMVKVLKSMVILGRMKKFGMMFRICMHLKTWRSSIQLQRTERGIVP